MPKKKTAPPSRWDRVFIDRAVLEGYRRGPEPVYKLADAMLSGESVSYEEFSDKDNLGSARLSGADRALIVNFGRTAMIAGIAEHHAYAQSPLYHLRDGVAKYRAKYGASIEKRIAEAIAEEEAAAAREVAGERAAAVHRVTPLSCYNQNFIRLNSEQAKVLQVNLPALVSGPPGSGKSCVAISLIQQVLSRLSQEPDARILYVTQSPELIEAMEKIWAEISLPEALKRRVEFKTYETVAREQPSAYFVGKTPAKEADFEQWLKGYLDTKKTALKPAAAAAGTRGKKNRPSEAELELNHYFEERNELYQEFRLLSGYRESADDYLKLGEDAGLYPPASRRWILEAYDSYLNYLKDNHKYSLDFLPVNEQDKYDFVLGDEAQDLSDLQLRFLMQLAKDGQVCFCMDTHQSLFDCKSKRPFLLGMKGMNHIELPHAYRCPENVVHFANKVISIKNTVVGGAADKWEKPEIKMSAEQKNKGIVHWLEQTPEELDKLKKLARQSNFAVITLPEYIDEARRKYGEGVLIFTPEQIKGLEYENVVLYRMLDNAHCRDASRKLGQIGPDGKVPVHRSRRGCSDERFGPALNKFFTSSTRATGALIIDQDEGHPLTWLCKALKEGIKTPKSAFLRELLSEQTAEEQLAGWELEVCRLYREGKKEWSQHAFHRWIEGKLPYADYESFLLAHELIKKEMPLAEEKQEKEATPEIEPPAGEATEPQAALPEPAKEEAAGSRRNRKKKAKRKASQSAQKAQPSITASLSLKPPQTMDQASPFPSSNALVRSPATFFANRGVKRNLGLPGTVADLEASLNTVKLSKIATSGELVKTCDAIIAQGTDLEKKWAEIQKEKEQAKTALLPGDLKVQRFLNELFNNFSKQYLDKIFKRVPPYKPETILKWFVLTENQGYDCFLSRLKFDKGNLKPNEDKWLALQHYEGLNSYFSLQELTRTEPASGKTYFEILCRKQCGLNFLNSIWASMSIPETVHSGALAQLWTTFYAASSTNAWDDLDDKENLLIYLINYPGGLAVFETLFSSSLFATLRWMDKEKNTLLHWAVSDQRKDLVKSIMRARAAALGGGYLKPEFDVLGIKNSQNLTAFELAKKNNSSKIIDALNPSNYEKSSGTNTPPFHDEEYITVAIQEIAKTRGSIQIPAIKKIVNETNALRHDQKVCRDKLSLNPRNKELRKKLKLVETVIDERMSQHNELEREIRVNALFQLTKANLGSKAMYEQLDLLVVGTPPDLLFTCLTASITPKLPPLLYCLFTTSLWSDDREGPWGSFLKYMEDNPVLVNFNFSLKQLFKVDKNSVKSRFETLVRSREGLVFLHAIFKMLSISDTVGEELHAGIITHLYPDITARPWGDLSEADTLLIYLINRSEGREILAKFPPNMFFNMIAQQDAQWNSFLHWAVISQRADLISMVLKLEQRLSDKTALPRYLGLKNEAGQTALDIAKENNFKLGIDLLSVKANEISKHKAAETSFENLPVSVNPF